MLRQHYQLTAVAVTFIGFARQQGQYSGSRAMLLCLSSVESRNTLRRRLLALHVSVATLRDKVMETTGVAVDY